MSASSGINLRVTAHLSQGGRKYMEDMFTVAYERTQDNKDLKYAFFGIFDGHGGQEAAKFAKDNLMDCIVRQEGFWSERDEDVLRAIYDGFVKTQLSMWRNLENWPKTAAGLPSTSGTTASVAFIKKNKLYIGHVGDSSIALGFQTPDEKAWKAQMLTEDHKPECASESERIRSSGGRVAVKAGVPRIVWNRPRLGHSGPVRRSTQFDEIPFLAVARSLGDLWSYNAESNQFVVSPEPDVTVTDLDPGVHRCLVLATDGLWNVLGAAEAVGLVQHAVQRNDQQLACCETGQERPWINPSKKLVEKALEKWKGSHMRADNTSALTILLNPCGPSRAEVLCNQTLYSEAPEASEPGARARPSSPGRLSPHSSSDGKTTCNGLRKGGSDPDEPDVVTFTRHPMVSSGTEYEDTSEVECLGGEEESERPEGATQRNGSGYPVPKPAACERDPLAKLPREGRDKAAPGSPRDGGDWAKRREKRPTTAREVDEIAAKCQLFRLSDGVREGPAVDRPHAVPDRRLSENVLGRSPGTTDPGTTRGRRASEGTPPRRKPPASGRCDENDINKLNPGHWRKSPGSSPGGASSRRDGGKQGKVSSDAENRGSPKPAGAVARSDRALRSKGPTLTLLSRNVNGDAVATAAQDARSKRCLSPYVKADTSAVRRIASPLRKKLRSGDWGGARPMVTRSQANRRHSKP
ncbi:uncharacterized protein LOC134541254 [Bacillus rossius redtenbacheri]|uniref:uncharacterized protein LOC134541254 n=1 Tax=Bacillus rossius redtenbacheri TaxID=93214 RepID=UPI002FDDB04E